jgi:hypothetical protein
MAYSTYVVKYICCPMHIYDGVIAVCRCNPCPDVFAVGRAERRSGAYDQILWYSASAISLEMPLPAIVVRIIRIAIRGQRWKRIRLR